MIAVEMTVNGQPAAANVEARTLLIDFLRDHLKLTGTHRGCDTSQCGACVVHLDGRSIKACTLLAVQASGSKVLTIEGVANGTTLHPLQEALREHHGLQCGFCTSGVVMSALDLLRRQHDPTEQQIRTWLEGNFCRCTGYSGIIRAIAAAAAATNTPSQGRDEERRAGLSMDGGTRCV